MNDLISRQAAIDALAKFVPYAICDESTESYTNGLTDAYNLILQLPSAQPEIIYCRECRHWYTGDGYNHENGAQCELMHMWMGPDDYCSYGRRKVSE